MTEHRRNQLTAIALGLACVVLFGLGLATRDTRSVTDDLSGQVDVAVQLQQENADYLAAGRESRIQFQARETFLLCSRDLVKTVIPERQREVREVCEGYQTMADALETEHLVQSRANP